MSAFEPKDGASAAGASALAWNTSSYFNLSMMLPESESNGPTWSLRIDRTVPPLTVLSSLPVFTKKSKRNSENDVEVSFFDDKNTRKHLEANNMPYVYVDRNWFDTVVVTRACDGPTFEQFGGSKGTCSVSISTGIQLGLLYFNIRTRDFPSSLGPVELGPAGQHNLVNAGFNLVKQDALDHDEFPIWRLHHIGSHEPESSIYREDRPIEFTEVRTVKNAEDDVEVLFYDGRRVLCTCHMRVYVNRDWYNRTVVPYTSTAPTFESFAPEPARKCAIAIRTGILLGLLFWDNNPHHYPNPNGPDGPPVSGNEHDGDETETETEDEEGEEEEEGSNEEDQWEDIDDDEEEGEEEHDKKDKDKETVPDIKHG